LVVKKSMNFKINQRVRIKETGEVGQVIGVGNYGEEKLVYVDLKDSLGWMNVNNVEPLKRGRPKKNHNADTGKKVVRKQPKKPTKAKKMLDYEAGWQTGYKQAKEDRPDIQVTTLGTDYELKGGPRDITGHYKIFVYKGKDGLSIFNNNHQMEFIFQDSKPEVVKAIGELLVKCSGI
jgi:hypothetical protein